MQHYKAIMKQRALTLKRSKKDLGGTIVLVLVYGVIGIVMNYVMKLSMDKKPEDITLKSFGSESANIAIVNHTVIDNIIDIIKGIVKEDLDKEAKFKFFDSIDELNEYTVKMREDQNPDGNIILGLAFHGLYGSGGINNVTVIYNKTVSSDFYPDVITTRLFWKKQFGADTDIKYSTQLMIGQVLDVVYGSLSPTFMVMALLGLIPVMTSSLITFIKGETRDYMISCSLSLPFYWLATFTVDYIIYLIVTTVLWAIYNIAMIKNFQQNLGISWYTLALGGPGLLLLMYDLSFIFKNPQFGSFMIFFVLLIIELIPMIVDMARQNVPPKGIEWFYGLFPQIGMQRILTYSLPNVDENKKSFAYYWKYEYSQPGLILQFANIVIYSVILYIIEVGRIFIRRKAANSQFNSYENLFEETREKHQPTEEVAVMEEEVKNTFDYAIRIDEVSRLFFNSQNVPITAVNNVSLGIKEGTLFGFLGANGAGKTTIIKMLTSLIPPSAGSIEINGVDVSASKGKNLAYCPQFNDHLCMEMTPMEHFKVYSLIFKLDEKETEEKIAHLVEILDLDEAKDRPVTELSGGNQRKVAVAIAFLNPANIILLDEPTSSLDPVARKNVHELIKENRGSKTYMLCTHLLNEAEALCDMISIMIKGCIYTIGSPQYLSQKFGTEYRIDVSFEFENEENDRKCLQFFESQLPAAKQVSVHNKSRSYSIPSAEITLPELFTKMEDGLEGDNGYDYYTCSSTSLDRVFMEIVKLSEIDVSIDAEKVNL